MIEQSVITCPNCGVAKLETMPTDACQFFYECTGCGALLLLPFSLWEFSTGVTFKPDLLSIATLIYVVIFPSTLAYLFFNRAIALIGPNRTAPFLHLVPVLALHSSM